MQTSLKRKFLAYTAAKRAALAERHMGWKAFRVLVITSSQVRADNCLKSIRENVHENGRSLFIVADREFVVTDDILAYAWRDARGETLSLI